MAQRLFLHLEDNRIAQKLLARTLSRFGECIGFSTIKEAEAYMTTSPQIDAFFVDYTLSDGNGLCFVKKLRSVYKYPDAPILLITSTLTNEVAFKAMRAGVNESLSKLTSPTLIRRIVARQIKRPYVKLVNRDGYEVWCAIWEKNGQYYQYCPEMDLTISARTPEEAQAQMRAKLATLIYSEKKTFDSVMHVEGFSHRFSLEPSQE